MLWDPKIYKFSTIIQLQLSVKNEWKNKNFESSRRLIMDIFVMDNHSTSYQFDFERRFFVIKSI